MIDARRIFVLLKGGPVLSWIVLKPFYVARFIYHAIRENSTWFFRYYPGYHGATIPSGRFIARNRQQIFYPETTAADQGDLNEGVQLSLLEAFAEYRDGFSPPPEPSPGWRYYYRNAMFGFNDGFFLYCFLRHYRPSRVIEIGSGYSSALMLDLAPDIIPTTHFTFVDPYSVRVTELLKDAGGEKYTLIREEVQNVDGSVFGQLGEGDVLFIDSSHVVKIGSDLSALVFKIIPSLKKGVIIHFHDIWFPWEYPEAMLHEGVAYNEIYFVRAFLQFNESFEILFFSSYVEQRHAARVARLMPGYLQDSGKSLWIRKVK